MYAQLLAEVAEADRRLGGICNAAVLLSVEESHSRSQV
jgi:hypothetical protein